MTHSTIEKIETLITRIRFLEQKYQRPPNSVQLLVVTKNRSADEVLMSYKANQRHFGESYVQEALEKMEVLASYPDCDWHFIGPIQRNKTKKIAEHFSWVHSVANFLTVERLSAQRPNELPPLNICIQINFQNELTKSGIKPDQVFDLIEQCQSLKNIWVRGLMCIPASGMSFEEQKNIFRELSLLKEKLNAKHFNLDTLSMGMSEDMEAAIAEGATIVRIGRAIFDEDMK